LFKTGDVQISSLCGFERGHTQIHNWTFFSFPKLSHNGYFLKKDEAADFIQLWKKLQNIATNPRFDFPLKRFMDTYEEKMAEDKIVDGMVAFESIVFRNVKEIGHKATPLAIAIAMFLGNSQKERDEIRKAMLDAYDIRNARVHALLGKLQHYKRQNIERLAIKVQDYLRSALRRFVEE